MADSNDICALCKGSNDTCTLWIGCEGFCEAWFHTACVYITDKDYGVITKYDSIKFWCPPCVGLLQKSGKTLIEGQNRPGRQEHGMCCTSSVTMSKTLDSLQKQVDSLVNNLEILSKHILHQDCVSKKSSHNGTIGLPEAVETRPRPGAIGLKPRHSPNVLGDDCLVDSDVISKDKIDVNELKNTVMVNNSSPHLNTGFIKPLMSKKTGSRKKPIFREGSGPTAGLLEQFSFGRAVPIDSRKLEDKEYGHRRNQEKFVVNDAGMNSLKISDCSEIFQTVNESKVGSFKSGTINSSDIIGVTSESLAMQETDNREQIKKISSSEGKGLTRPTDIVSNKTGHVTSRSNVNALVNVDLNEDKMETYSMVVGKKRENVLGSHKSRGQIDTSIMKNHNRSRSGSSKYIVGTGSLNSEKGVNCSLRAIPVDNTAWLHVWRLHKDTTCEELVQFLKNSIPEAVFACEKLNAKGPYASFKVGVNRTLVKDLLVPSFWPENVAVNKFFWKRVGNYQQT